MNSYAALALSAFLAATLLPLSSEAVLAALALSEGADAAVLWTIATAANTLGSVVNWCLGRFCRAWQDRPWFPVSPRRLLRAEDHFRRFGLWSLLAAWLPVVGDPLTFAAGLLRVDLRVFIILVGIGKGARYAAVLATTQLFG